MKILFFIAEVSAGGAENQLIDFCNALPDEHQYTFVYIRGGELEYKLDDKRYMIKKLPNIKLKVLRYFIQAYYLSQIIKLQKIDIVYSFLFEANLITYLTKSFSNFKFISSLRTTVDNHFVNKSFRNKLIVAILKLVYKKSDVIIANSSVGHHYFGLKHFVTIPNFISHQTIEQILSKKCQNIRNKTICLGTLSRLSAEKNPYNMMEVSHLLSDTFNTLNKILWIGKNSFNLTILKQHAAVLNVDFEYLGEQKERFGYMASFDVAFLFSDYEGISNFLLEAMAMGKKIVATDVGDNKLILDPRTSIIVPKGDTKAFTSAIYEILNRDISQEILNEVSHNVINNYTLEENIKRHFIVFERILDDKKNNF